MKLTEKVHLDDGTHKLELSVLKMTMNFWGEVPIAISSKYYASNYFFNATILVFSVPPKLFWRWNFLIEARKEPTQVASLFLGSKHKSMISLPTKIGGNQISSEIEKNRLEKFKLSENVRGRN